MQIQRSSEKSIRQELRLNDFPKTISTIAVPNDDWTPIQHTLDLKIDNKPIFWTNSQKQIAALAQYFGPLKCCDIFKMTNDPFHIGQCHAQITWPFLLRTLIEADILMTYIHMESTVLITEISPNQAKVSGTHSYYTNCQNTDHFSLLVEWNNFHDIVVLRQS